MKSQTQLKAGRGEIAETPIWVEFSELLEMFADRKIIVADGRHHVLDGNVLRRVRVRWRDQ